MLTMAPPPLPPSTGPNRRHISMVPKKLTSISSRAFSWAAPAEIGWLWFTPALLTSRVTSPHSAAARAIRP